MYKGFSWPLTSTRIPQIGFVKIIDKRVGLQSGLHWSLIWMSGKVWMEPVGTVSLTPSGWDNLCLVDLMPVLVCSREMVGIRYVEGQKASEHRARLSRRLGCVLISLLSALFPRAGSFLISSQVKF